MENPEIAQVRSFNRTVTERMGALGNRYLGRDRPLGEARLLWEITVDGRELDAIGARMGLDPGNVGQMVRSLQAQGLVEVEASSRNPRARVVRLSPQGRRERNTLDERSDELAGSLLKALTFGQRTRLIAAMGEVERILTAAAVTIDSIDSEDDDAQRCLARYGAELNQRSSRPFDPTVGATALPHEVRPPAGQFFVAYLYADPVGCGAVKHHDDAPAEIKRMWIAPEARGLGLGRRLLEVLESCAREAGAHAARLETSTDLGEAISLYKSAGWVEVEPFNDEPFADRWFEKVLVDGGAE